MTQLETSPADQDYLRETMALPLLSRERELELAKAWKEQGDVKAMHELVRAYGRLAVAMAAKFRHYGLPLGDLIQEGNIGLLQAAARFEPARELRFSTYAIWWIRSAMQDYILRNWSIVRTGTTASQKTLFFNLRRLRARIAGATGETSLSEVSRALIAKELGVPLHDVRAMERRLSGGGDQSLNAPLAVDGDDDAMDFLPDERPNPEDVVISLKDSATRSKWLNHALEQLDARERAIIKARNLHERDVTLEQLGKKLGVSKERVRQLEARAMAKLKATLLRLVGGKRELLLGQG